MSRDNSAPFERGSTFYQGRPIDANNLQGVELEGLVKEFEDINHNDLGAKSLNSGRRVKCMIVRNKGVTNALPGKCYKVLATNPFHVGAIADAAGERVYPVDEFLPSAGVPPNDLFWVILDGPAKLALTNGSGLTGGDLMLVTTTGTVTVAGAPADATAARNQVINSVGRLRATLASGITTGLVEVKIHM